MTLDRTLVTSKRLFRCKRCGKFFLTAKALTHHKQIHPGKRGDKIKLKKGKRVKAPKGIVLDVKQVSREQRKLQDNLFNEQMRKTAAIAKYHVLGSVIGSTQVTQFKSPNSDIRWATKRKQKQ